MNATRNISILILLLLIGFPAVAAENEPDPREAERRALLEGMKNARPMTPPEPTKLFTPEETASADQRAIVFFDPATGTLTVNPASDLFDGTSTGSEPFHGLFEEAPPFFGQDVKSDPEGTQAIPLTALVDATEAPFRSVVKILMRFTLNGLETWGVCSGAMINEFHVLTAGHCLYTWDFNGDKISGDRAWATDVWVFPAQGDAVDPFNDIADPDQEEDWPFGIARSVGYRLYTGWIDSMNYDHDYAVITLNRRSGLHTGWMGIETGLGDTLNYTGYPVEAKYGYGGEVVQWFAHGPVIEHTDYRVRLDALSYGGHSGGPTWRFLGGARWIEAVGSTSNRMGSRTDTRVTSGKYADLNSFIAEDNVWRPPVAMPDLQECFFLNWGCGKDIQINTVWQGGATRVVYNVVNTGFAPSGEITIDFYLSADDIITPADTLIASGPLASLEPLTAYSQWTELYVPYSVPPGDYYVGWIVHASVPEYDVFPYDNNTAVIANERLTVLATHSVDVTSPNGGEIWNEGSSRTINWTAVDAGSLVSIELSRNGGATWQTITSSTHNDGSFTWTVSGPSSDACRVRVTSLTYHGVADVSDANFRIMPSLNFIEVTAPDGGEFWYAGHAFDITWNSLLAGPTVRIDLSRNSGITWETITAATANDGHYAWTVTTPTSNSCAIRVTSTTAPAATDMSDGVFSISVLASSVHVQAPDGGELLAIGRPYDIRWTSSFLFSDVRIELSRTGGLFWETLTAATPNDGLFTWTVTGPTTTAARVRITSVNNSFVSDTSAASFSILYILSSIQVASPSGGESGFVGYPFDISWNTTYVTGDVKIELTRNAGGSWETISASTPNDGLFRWIVTAPTSGSCKVRISSVDNSIVNDVSDGYFSIFYLLSTLSLTSPNGGEELYKARLFDITWASSYLPGEVAIDLSRDGGDSWETIVPSTPNDGIFSWVTTGAMSDDCLMRVRSIGTPVLSDTSDGIFTISSLTPRLQVDYPNGGESLRVAAGAYVIRWSSALVTSQVAIELSRDAGATWETISAATNNDGLHLWWVTGPETSEARLRISAVDAPSVEDTSDGEFSISKLYDVQLRDLRRMGGGQLELQWTDTDWEDEYEIYRGTLTAPFTYSHDTVLACGIGGGTTFWISPDDQETGQPSYYYLVVPHGLNNRVFGEDSDGVLRPEASTTCP